MDKNIKQIIKEEVYKVMMEVGEEDQMKLSQDMIASNEEQIQNLEAELKYRESDTRVSNLPSDEKKARITMVKLLKDRVEAAKMELEMSKQSEINAVKFNQIQSQIQPQQVSSSQIQPQT